MFSLRKSYTLEKIYLVLQHCHSNTNGMCFAKVCEKRLGSILMACTEITITSVGDIADRAGLKHWSLTRGTVMQ